MAQPGAHSNSGNAGAHAARAASNAGKPPVRMVRAGSHIADSDAGSGASTTSAARSAAAREGGSAGSRFATPAAGVHPVTGAATARAAAPGAATTTPTAVRPAAAGTTAPASAAARPATGAVAPHPVAPAPVKPSSYTHGGGRGANASRGAAGGNGGGNGHGRGGHSTGNGADPRKPKRRRSIVATVLIIVGVALLLTAGGLFIKAQLGYQQAQSAYKDLEKYAVSDTAGDGVPNVDLDELAKINPDVVGWIYVPGTPINYPVVQTTNNTTYLSLLFDKTGNGSGSIFMDMDDTAPGMVDEQTTLYGHHMNDGSMFRAIDGTLDQASFDKIGNVYYITRATTYVLKPMFTAQVEDTYINARRAVFEGTDTSLQDYLASMLDQAKAQSSDADELVKNTKQVLTLVTCAGEIIPRTTRAAMVCTVTQTVDRSTGTVTDINTLNE